MIIKECRRHDPALKEFSDLVLVGVIKLIYRRESVCLLWTGTCLCEHPGFSTWFSISPAVFTGGPFSVPGKQCQCSLVPYCSSGFAVPFVDTMMIKEYQLWVECFVLNSSCHFLSSGHGHVNSHL